VLSVTLLRRSVAAEIDSAWVGPIHQHLPVGVATKGNRPIPGQSAL
jgi:hypothetical protein